MAIKTEPAPTNIPFGYVAPAVHVGQGQGGVRTKRSRDDMEEGDDGVGYAASAPPPQRQARGRTPGRRRYRRRGGRSRSRGGRRRGGRRRSMSSGGGGGGGGDADTVVYAQGQDGDAQAFATGGGDQDANDNGDTGPDGVTFTALVPYNPHRAQAALAEQAAANQRAQSPPRRRPRRSQPRSGLRTRPRYGRVARRGRWATFHHPALNSYVESCNKLGTPAFPAQPWKLMQWGIDYARTDNGSSATTFRTYVKNLESWTVSNDSDGSLKTALRSNSFRDFKRGLVSVVHAEQDADAAFVANVREHDERNGHGGDW